MLVWDADDTGLLSDHDLRLLQRLADIGAVALLRERAASNLATTNQQLQNALESRVRIEQAKGMVAQCLGIETTQAFQLIRTRARSSRARVDDVATLVVSRQLGIETMNESAGFEAKMSTSAA